jgi:hypothetical protein
MHWRRRGMIAQQQRQVRQRAENVLACHEACHCVVALAVGVPVRGVRIEQRADGVSGVADIPINLASTDPVEIEKFLAVMVAGELGCAMLVDNADRVGFRSETARGSIEDKRTIEHFLRQVGPQAEAMLARAEARAVGILDRHRDAVVRLADNLVSAGSLDGSAVGAVLGDIPTTGAPSNADGIRRRSVLVGSIAVNERAG